MNTVDERLNVSIFENSNTASLAIANSIAKAIRERQKTGRNIVLGLIAGSSPLAIYSELVRLHREEGLSFHNVVTYNVDENAKLSQYMYENLYDHIDIEHENIHMFECDIEKEIIASGGIDIMIVGIGLAGQIGHNEPGATRFSRTRKVRLGRTSTHFPIEDSAMTMGIATILEAKNIYLIAWGETKAAMVYNAVEGEISESVPASFLQYHQQCKLFVDDVAASKLSRIRTPWLLGSCQWNDRLVRKAVIWLCERVGKPVLKLTDADYRDNSMVEIIKESSAYQINIKVFNDLQHTITGWPGGKPDADDTQRPERREPHVKRVVIFSPHPDDDVISMGGTLSRLVKQGHDVHVVYQTSGNTAVSDNDVLRYIEFGKACGNYFGVDECKLNGYINYLNGNDVDSAYAAAVRDFKGKIRRGEAKAACRYLDVKTENIHFLDLPFYETGTIKKGEITSADTNIIKRLLTEVKPHQIFAAGDLSDPHGTHRNCMKTIEMSLSEMSGDEWLQSCYVWLYRGAWQEWNVEDVDMAVPLSPDEVLQKRHAIFKHQSQKDGALFPGTDSREFWQRAEERNHNTADVYDKLGMAEYEAMEVFVRLKNIFEK